MKKEWQILRLSPFKMPSGGCFRGQPWNEKLPTDSELLVHWLSVYLDTRYGRYRTYLPTVPVCRYSGSLTALQIRIQHFSPMRIWIQVISSFNFFLSLIVWLCT